MGSFALKYLSNCYALIRKRTTHFGKTGGVHIFSLHIENLQRLRNRNALSQGEVLDRLRWRSRLLRVCLSYSSHESTLRPTRCLLERLEEGTDRRASKTGKELRGVTHQRSQERSSLDVQVGLLSVLKRTHGAVIGASQDGSHGIHRRQSHQLR